MYIYRFVKVDLDGFFILERKPKENHHQIIREHAEKGWRLVQIFAPSVSTISGGTPNYFELIFERKKDEKLCT
jgi:hypothetical protein